jgi:hypothetical protein
MLFLKKMVLKAGNKYPFPFSSCRKTGKRIFFSIIIGEWHSLEIPQKRNRGKIQACKGGKGGRKCMRASKDYEMLQDQA